MRKISRWEQYAAIIIAEVLGVILLYALLVATPA